MKFSGTVTPPVLKPLRPEVPRMISFPRFWSHRDLVIDLPGGFQLGWGVVGWWKTLHISLEKKVKSKEILRIMQPRKTAATIDGSSHIVITRWLQFSVAMAAWELQILSVRGTSAATPSWFVPGGIRILRLGDRSRWKDPTPMRLRKNLGNLEIIGKEKAHCGKNNSIFLRLGQDMHYMHLDETTVEFCT